MNIAKFILLDRTKLQVHSGYVDPMVVDNFYKVYS